MVFGLSTMTNFPQHMTIVGRQFALEHGWYRIRRPAQTFGSVGMLLASVAIVVGLRTQFRSLRPPEWLALLAMSCLFNLTIIQAISLHDVDDLLSTRLFGLRFGTLAELLILLCIIVAAAWAGRLSRTKYSEVRSQESEG